MTWTRLKSAIIALAIVAGAFIVCSADSRSASARSDSRSASARLDSRSASARLDWNLALGDGSPSIDLASTAHGLQTDRLAIPLDASGKRGLVLFHHETHEGRRFRSDAL